MEFSYTARTKTGQLQTGTVEAASLHEAVMTLQQHNLIILNLEPLGGSVFARRLEFLVRVKQKELVSFSRQLSTLFSAQVPLLESLRGLASQTENSYFKEVLFAVSSDVESGTPLSKSLQKYPKVFSSFYVNMVRSGEVSGNLDRILNYLADYLEKQYYLVSKIKGAMLYPAFILAGFLIIGTLMLIFVIPQLTSILKETGQALPLPTRIIIAASNFLRAWWWLIFLVLLGAIVGWSIYIKKNPRARFWWDNLKIKLPIFGKIFQKFYLSRLCDNLSTLMRGGLPILRALRIGSEVVGHMVYQRILIEAREEVRTGSTISSVFEQYEKEVPPMVTKMMITGERTGALDTILEKLATFYSKEVDNVVGSLPQLIEPILIIILGIGVGILVAAILLPIYNIASGI